jgi:hypothetical protein
VKTLSKTLHPGYNFFFFTAVPQDDSVRLNRHWNCEEKHKRKDHACNNKNTLRLGVRQFTTRNRTFFPLGRETKKKNKRNFAVSVSAFNSNG